MDLNPSAGCTLCARIGYGERDGRRARINPPAVSGLSVSNGTGGGWLVVLVMVMSFASGLLVLVLVAGLLAMDFCILSSPLLTTCRSREGWMKGYGEERARVGRGACMHGCMHVGIAYAGCSLLS